MLSQESQGHLAHSEKVPFDLEKTVLIKVGRILVEMLTAYLQEGRYAVTMQNLLYIWMCKHTYEELYLILFLEKAGLRFHIYMNICGIYIYFFSSFGRVCISACMHVNMFFLLSYT